MMFESSDKSAQIALEETQELFRILTEERGFAPFDVIAGMHGEIVHQMIVNFGFAETEQHVGILLATIMELVDAEVADPISHLMFSQPVGSA